MYKLQFLPRPHRMKKPVVSDVGAFGMIGGGGGWQIATSLFGVVKVIVVLVGAWRGGGVWGKGEDEPTNQTEKSPNPARVEGDAEWHHDLLMVGGNGKPDGWHQTTQSYEEQRKAENQNTNT